MNKMKELLPEFDIKHIYQSVYSANRKKGGKMICVPFFLVKGREEAESKNIIETYNNA